MITIAFGTIILLLVIGCGIGSVVHFGRADPEAWKSLQGKRQMLGCGYWFFCLKRKLLRLLKLEEREEAFYQGIYVNEHYTWKRLEDACRQGVLIVVVFAGLGVFLILATLAGTFRDTRVVALERPEEGTGVRHLRAFYEGESYDLAFSLTERQMTTEDVLLAWNIAKLDLPELILGENKSLDEVTFSLVLPEQLPGTGIAIQWLTSNYKVLDYEGNLHEEEISPEGEDVTLTAVLTYGEWEERLEISVKVLPSDGVENSDLQQHLNQSLLEYAEEQKYERQVELPTMWEEKPIAFYQKRDGSPWMFVSLAGILLAGLLLAGESSRKQLQKEREQQLLRDYPDVVSKLTLLLEAGMAPRYAWERIANDYLYRKQKDGIRRYVYEEMVRCKNQLTAGVVEEQVYESFGKRCANIRYLRLSSVLVQNIKKGTASIIPLLRKEALEAFADRKERAKQAGEEAGTKLLLPMGGILVLILAIVMIPAFMSF